MLSNDYYIYEKINQIIFNKKKEKKQVRISFLYFLKINFIILFFAFFYFKVVKIISKLIFFSNFKKISNSNQFTCIKIASFLLYPLKKKVFELIFSLSLIQSRFPNQKEIQKEDKNIDFKENKVFEAIVIGSGPGGAISSYYLNEKFKSKILMLEQGGHYENFKTKHPGREFLKMWKNGGVNSTFFGKMISYASGSCLGGGSEINSGLFHSPDRSFIDNWKLDCKVEDLDDQILKQKFNELTSICKIEKNFLRNNIPSYSHFLNGAELNNFKVEELNSFYSFNGKNNVSKNSMSNTFIKKYLENDGKFCCNIIVTKIAKEKNYWKIYAKYKKRCINFYAKNIFLCCGSIYTTHLLEKSKVKLNNKISNFKFHPMIKLIAEFNHKVQNGDENVHPFQITEFYPDFIIGNASSGKEFIDLNFPDNLNLNNNDDSWKNKLIYHLTYSFGKGKVINFFDNPLTHYDVDGSNIELIKKSLILASKVLFDGGAKELTILNNKPLKLSKNNYEKIIQNIKMSHLKFSAVHILGGLKSGNNKKCHVNSYGKIYNQDNIYVNDSSLISHKLLKNPQGTLMSLVKRNIDHFLDNAR